MTVSLHKGQQILLDQEAGTALHQVTVGLGWDAVKTRGMFGFRGRVKHIDLEAACFLFDADHKALDVVSVRQLGSRDGSVRQSGEPRSRVGGGDVERIDVDLVRLPSYVQALVFTVNSFTGQNFAQVQNAFCRIVNAHDQIEVARYDLSVQGSHSAQVMAKLYRHGGGWKMHAIGERGTGRCFDELLPQIQPFL